MRDSILVEGGRVVGVKEGRGEDAVVVVSGVVKVIREEVEGDWKVEMDRGERRRRVMWGVGGGRVERE